MMRNNTKTEGPSPEERLWELQADICQTLANPKRLQILALLKDQKELSVGEMVRALKIPKPNLSQHLALMRQKGILRARRQGTVIYYRLATPAITAACEVMRQVLLQALQEKGELSARLEIAVEG
ncbi:MAG: metalloregulator ArsR/SmtB family transcription factor [Desulfobaccales bacterium]